MDETDPVSDPAALRSHHPNVRVERDGHVVTVTLDRPESKNACTGDMWVALGATFRELGYSGARVVVLTGAGGDFCTGADLSGRRSGSGGGGRAARSATMIDAMRVLGDVVLAIHGCPVPVVAEGRRPVRRRRARARARRRPHVVLGPRPVLGHLRQARAQHGLRHVVAAAPAHRRAQGQGARVHREDAERHRGARARPRERGRAGRRARRGDGGGGRRRSPAGPPIALAATKRELDAASTSSLAQALELEALAQSVNVHTDDLREALIAYVERRPPNVHGPVAAAMATDEQTGNWDEVLDDLAAAARRARARWAATSGCAKHRGAGKLDARARIDHLLDPGSFLELGTLVGGEDAPADAVVMGSGRIDGRPVMVAAEDFTVKAGHDQRGRERQALPRRRDRGHRPRAAGHDAGGRRLPGRRQGSRPRTPTDLLAQARCSGRVPLVTAVLGASAGHGALVAPMSDFTRDEPARASIFTAGPPVVLRVDGRDDHQGGPRRSGASRSRAG